MPIRHQRYLDFESHSRTKRIFSFQGTCEFIADVDGSDMGITTGKMGHRSGLLNTSIAK